MNQSTPTPTPATPSPAAPSPKIAPSGGSSAPPPRTTTPATPHAFAKAHHGGMAKWLFITLIRKLHIDDILMLHPLMVVILPLALALVVLGGALLWWHMRQYEDTDDAFIDGEVVQVAARVPGIIQEVAVNDNQDLPAGAVLARLDPRDYEARLHEAQAAFEAATAKVAAAEATLDLTRTNTAAALTQALAGLEQAHATVHARQEELASSLADVAAAAAEAQRRQSDRRRYEALDPRAVSRLQVDAVEATATSTEANLAAARKRAAAADAATVEAQARVAYAEGALAAARTGPQQVAAALAQLNNASAAAAQARAALTQAELDLSYTYIRAPVAGRVTRRTARPGQYLQVGQALLALVEPDVWVTANFKENQIAHMRRGDAVAIRVDSYHGHVFHGRVDSIQAGSGARFSMLPPENASGNYVKVVQRVPVKILIDAADARGWLLAPGMSVIPRVHVDVNARHRPEPIAPPSSAPVAVPAA